ncbi:hypothetical protein [Bacteroides zoogleoformans]|nr:hypothetical protein [Bacteroides zoogleoformans]
MTIQNIGEYTSGVKAYCTWFVSGELKEGYFSLESLVKI